MNELVRNQCDVTNHQVNVQFLLQLQPEWQRFVTLVKQIQELKTVSYHKLYDILKQHQNEVNEIRAGRLARIANPLALVAQQQLVYHPQNILITTLNIPQPDHNKLPEIEEKKLSTLLLLFMIKNLINKGTGYDNQRVVNVAGTRENVEQPDWRDDTDDEPDDQELEAHYMYMAQIQEVTPDAVDNSGPIFDVEPLQKEQGDNNITFDSLDMCYDREQDDHDDDDDLAKEQDLLASLIEKLKCEIDDSKNRNKFLELSNKALVDKLNGETEDFKTKNKSLESSNNHFKEVNNELSKTNQLMFKDLKKFQAKLYGYHDVNYASKVAIDCAKAKGDLMSYKI
ncbi:hypothetical protein Tco_1048009 [Tanacetum coccineum]